MCKLQLSKSKRKPGVVAHAFNSSTWEAEAGRFLSSRPAWSTKWVPRQPELHRETLSQKQNKTKQQQKQNNNKNNSNKKTYSRGCICVHLHVHDNKEKDAMNLRMAESWDGDRRRYLGMNGGRKWNEVN